METLERTRNEVTIQTERANRAEQEAANLREQLRNREDEIARLRQAVHHYESELTDQVTRIGRTRARAVAITAARPAATTEVDLGDYARVDPRAGDDAAAIERIGPFGEGPTTQA